ncbi:DUF6083 domain-containing protein [Streptomyces sp. 1-11]|uniref:DUF6083 domain-containing protein n=1 Tax=Streptomyces sp. 1-11 TaxID=2590549 RepID=UPI00280AEF51|nr:DUF6083 domain-containing protein [Streptomyces sp. 1-11]
MASAGGSTSDNAPRSRPRLVLRPRRTTAPGRTRLHIREDSGLSVSAGDGAFGYLMLGAPGGIRTCHTAPLAQTVPAEHRWIELCDGRVTVYGVCPPGPFPRCRIEHRLACSAQWLLDLWPWLTMLRGENGRHAERQLQADPEPPESPEEWPDAG